MKVHELQTMLAELPGEADVGCLDHFGRLIPLEATDVRWHAERQILEMPDVDIGPGPDEY